MRMLMMAVIVLVYANTQLGQVSRQDKWIGVWKLNSAKSGSAAPASGTTTIEAIPGGVRVVSETVSRTGATSRTEYSAKYDGSEAQVSGTPQLATASVTRIDDSTFEVVTRSQGATTVARNVISADGKTRTVTQTLKIGDTESKLILVYEKQP
jgi:hypothetical protein